MEQEEKNKNRGTEIDCIFSKSIAAGKRIYYLDVKQNRKGELFLILTESKKILDNNDSQNFHFEKHKIFLYKEEFDKFSEALNETIRFVKENNTVDFAPRREKSEDISLSSSIHLNLDF